MKEKRSSGMQRTGNGYSPPWRPPYNLKHMLHKRLVVISYAAKELSTYDNKGIYKKRRGTFVQSRLCKLRQIW